MNRRNIYDLTVSFILIILSNASGLGQDGDQNISHSHIKWITEYPELEDTTSRKNLFTRIFNLIAGERVNRLSKPVSVIAENNEDFWILDQGFESVFQISNNHQKLIRYTDRHITNLKSVVGICSLPDGSFIFTESNVNRIYQIQPGKRKEIMVFNDTLSLNRPTGIAYSEVNGEIWLVETNKHQITILSREGKPLRQIGKRGEGPGEFNFPTYIWIDKSGTAFIVDSMNFRIQIFDKEGNFEGMFGEIGDATGYFARPKGIAVDSHGNIYVVDALFHNVQIFDRSGNFLYHFGAQGRDKGHFWLPMGIYINRDDFIFIADSYNSRIQKFQFVDGNE
ncbi:6-bladed beta-propeller [Bacteroidota bacterium]